MTLGSTTPEIISSYNQVSFPHDIMTSFMYVTDVKIVLVLFLYSSKFFPSIFTIGINESVCFDRLNHKKRNLNKKRLNQTFNKFLTLLQFRFYCSVLNLCLNIELPRNRGQIQYCFNTKFILWDRVPRIARMQKQKEEKGLITQTNGEKNSFRN